MHQGEGFTLPYSDFKPESPAKPQEDEIRRKNHLYSDLFDLKPTQGQPPSTAIYPCDSHFLDTSLQKIQTDEMDPRERLMKFLRSDFDPPRAATPKATIARTLMKRPNSKALKLKEQQSDMHEKSFHQLIS